MKMKMKMKIKSYRYDINRPRSRHRHKYSIYRVSQYENAYICQATPKQHLKTHEKVKQR